MTYPDKKFIVEISQLIKSLMTFCEYEIENINNELSIFVKPKDIQNTLMFLKDNPSLSLDTLIDMTAIDYPNENDRFLIVYNLLIAHSSFTCLLYIYEYIGQHWVLG